MIEVESIAVMTGKKKNKKQVIFEAAARLFRDKGYPATSMRDLARAVDLKASSLYNHIQSKEDILRQICFENARRFLEGMEQVEKLPVNASQKIRALLRLHIRVATGDFTSVTAFNDEWRHLSEPYLSEFRELRREYEQRFRSLIEAGIKQGELRRADPSLILYTLLSSVRFLYDWYRPGKRLASQDLERDLVDLLMTGLEAGRVPAEM